MRVAGYIDGMNFYEASKDKQWYPAGWCNWTETLKAYCPSAEVSVRYFTTQYSGRDQARARRQELHLRAMKEFARAEIIFGSCRERPIQCPECKSALQCRCGCNRRFVEKMTDVNIAVRLLEDAIDTVFDRSYLVSADVDLLPAIHAVLRRVPESQVVVLLPPEAVVADEFAQLERLYPRRSIARHLDISKLQRFPDDLPRHWGMRLPAHWRDGAGRRPLRPELGITPPTKPRRHVPWFEESIGLDSTSAER